MNPSIPEPEVESGLPHSREAEEAAIGSVLINPDVLLDLRFLKDDDFYIHRLRFIWDAIRRLSGRHAPVDSLTVTAELDDMGRLDEIGGPAYLTALLNQVPTTLHAESYGQIIRAASIRRKLLTAANQIATLAYNRDEEIDTVVAKSEKAVFDIAECSTTKTSIFAREAISDLFDHVDALNRSKMPPGILTGLIDLDALLSGLVPGTSGLVGGRPGEGKTALFLTWIANIMKSPKQPTVVFNCMESTPRAITGRLAAIVSGIDADKIRKGTLADDEWPAFNHAVEVIGAWPLEIIDERDPMALYSEINHRVSRGECDLLMADYIGKYEAKAESRVRQVGIASSMSSKIATQFDIPVATTAQVSRTIDTRGKDSELVLSDLKETGDLEQDANWVLFINPEKNATQTNVKHCHLAKNRDGKTGRFDLIYRAPQTRFESAASRTIDMRVPYKDN